MANSLFSATELDALIAEWKKNLTDIMSGAEVRMMVSGSERIWKSHELNAFKDFGRFLEDERRKISGSQYPASVAGRPAR